MSDRKIKKVRPKLPNTVELHPEPIRPDVENEALSPVPPGLSDVTEVQIGQDTVQVAARDLAVIKMLGKKSIFLFPLFVCFDFAANSWLGKLRS